MSTDRAPSIPLRDRARERLRCAPFREALEVDPVGTAGAYDAFLCVELPLPWPRDVSLAEPFRSLLPDGVGAAASIAGTDGRSWRPVGLVPVDPAAPRRTVLAVERPEGGSGPYRRREWRVTPDALVPLCRSLLGGGVPADDLPGVDAVEVPDGLVELMVCTHGSRDVCCGSAGTTLHAELADRFGARDDVRLWRCSHTGGHRFAPTALTFPDGAGWAFLDAELAEQLLERGAPGAGAAVAVAGHCRGLSSVAVGPPQVADRAAFELVGWPWLAVERNVEVLSGPAPGAAVTVDDEWVLRVRGEVAARAVHLEVRVGIERLVANPTCGATDGPGDPDEPVWQVRSVVAVPG